MNSNYNLCELIRSTEPLYRLTITDDNICLNDGLVFNMLSSYSHKPCMNSSREYYNKIEQKDLFIAFGVNDKGVFVMTEKKSSFVEPKQSDDVRYLKFIISYYDGKYTANLCRTSNHPNDWRNILKILTPGNYECVGSKDSKYKIEYEILNCYSNKEDKYERTKYVR